MAEPAALDSDTTSATRGGWFTRLPLWGKVLFVIIWPVSVLYGVYWMWKDKKYSKVTRIALTALAVVVFLVGFSSSVSGNETSTESTPAQPVSTASEPASPQPEPSAASTAATEPAAPAAAPVESAPAPAPAPKKTVYKTLSTRGFQKLAKDPDSYAGDTYVIWGEITQFDSATGTDGFRADTGAKKKKPSYGFVDYPQNSVLAGDEKDLADFVEGDLFKAKVTVIGSYSYDTQIGGSTTVPAFSVDSISRYGHVSN